MVKLTVSYERPEELKQLQKLLGKNVKRVKTPRQQSSGKFRKAYIELRGVEPDKT